MKIYLQKLRILKKVWKKRDTIVLMIVIIADKQSWKMKQLLEATTTSNLKMWVSNTLEFAGKIADTRHPEKMTWTLEQLRM